MPQLTLWYLLLMAAVSALHWLVPERLRPLVLFAGGVTLLLALSPPTLAFLVPMALVSWASTPGKVRPWAITGLIVLAFVGLKVVAITPAWKEAELLLPVGFGIWSLRFIHHAVERGLGRLPALSLSTFAAWALFPPTLLVGPIDRAEDFTRDLQRKRWDPALAAEGLDRILIGFFKVVVLANWVVGFKLDDALTYSTAPGSPARVLGECVQYGLNLYLSFAGFSDLAIGWALLLGHRLPENFNWPFLTSNLPEFWRCWHATLGDWCRRYVFVPMQALTRSPIPGVVASMLAIGAWHEPTGRYLLWGLYHGLGIAAFRVWRRWVPEPAPDGASSWVRRVIAVLLTQAFVFLGFAITKNESLAGVARDLRALVGFGEG